MTPPISPAALQARLTPPSTAELAAAAEAQLLEADEQARGASSEGPIATTKADRRYTFEFDPKVQGFRGWVTLQPLNMEMRRKEAVTLLKLLGGLPHTSLSLDLQLQTRAIARLTYAIAEGPSWTKNLLAVEDPGVIVALYEVALDYEETFLKSRESA